MDVSGKALAEKHVCRNRPGLSIPSLAGEVAWQEERWWSAEVAPVAWYRIDVYAELPHGVVHKTVQDRSAHHKASGLVHGLPRNVSYCVTIRGGNVNGLGPASEKSDVVELDVRIAKGCSRAALLLALLCAGSWQQRR